MNFFKQVLLAPLISAFITIPTILLLEQVGFFDGLNQWQSVLVGIVCAGTGLIVGKVIEFKYS